MNFQRSAGEFSCSDCGELDDELLGHEGGGDGVVGPSTREDGLVEGSFLVLLPGLVGEEVVEDEDAARLEERAERLEDVARRGVQVAVEVHEADRWGVLAG